MGRGGDRRDDCQRAPRINPKQPRQFPELVFDRAQRIDPRVPKALFSELHWKLMKRVASAGERFRLKPQKAMEVGYIAPSWS